MVPVVQTTFSKLRYRVAHASIIAGLLALGLVLVTQLYNHFREDFLHYYGITPERYQLMQADVASSIPLTLIQVMLCFVVLFAFIAFVALERYRVRQQHELAKFEAKRHTGLRSESLSFQLIFDQMVLRSSLYSGVVLLLWILHTSLERYLGGFGWGLEYTSWRSLLPLVSVFGLSVLAGLIIASFSLVGVRTIYVLELALSRLVRAIRSTRNVLSFRRRTEDIFASPRDLFGTVTLTRPPPVFTS